MERSLGLYDEDLWKRIISQVGKIQKEESAHLVMGDILIEIQSLKEEVQNLSKRLGGICTLLPKTVYGKKLWLFTKIGTFTRQIKALKQRYAEHETRLSRCQVETHGLEGLRNIPIKGLYERFKCDNCGSQHLVAVKIKCSKCGAENWWGYWPQKS